MEKPKIRFKGYQEDWEQRKLSELATMHARIGWQNLRTSEFLDAGDYMLITGTDFEEGKVNYSTCHYVEKERYDQDKNIQIKNGNILITKDGTLGKVAYVEGLSLPATLNAGVFNVEVKDENETDSKYLFQFLKAPFLMDYVSKKATGGTIKHLNQNILVDFPIATPSRAEQVRIGEYFSTLDDLITLHQRKCEEMKTLKKYMLQKMFPQNGQSVPQIRFSGFTEDWEQRKLGEVFKEYSEKNHTELPALTIIQGGGTVKREESDRNLMYDESNLSNYKMVRKDDFIVHLRSFEGGLEKSSLDGIISPAYHTFHSDVADSRFYYPYFRSHEFIKHKLVPHVYGIRDGRSIDIAGMKTIEIPYTSIEEQRKIGDYLESLDHLITLHQQKCDELRNIKKFMLQNMFI